jgi:hypothetical protein
MLHPCPKIPTAACINTRIGFDETAIVWVFLIQVSMHFNKRSSNTRITLMSTQLEE